MFFHANAPEVSAGAYELASFPRTLVVKPSSFSPSTSRSNVLDVSSFGAFDKTALTVEVAPAARSRSFMRATFAVACWRSNDANVADCVMSSFDTSAQPRLTGARCSHTIFSSNSSKGVDFKCGRA